MSILQYREYLQQNLYLTVLRHFKILKTLQRIKKKKLKKISNSISCSTSVAVKKKEWNSTMNCQHDNG